MSLIGKVQIIDNALAAMLPVLEDEEVDTGDKMDMIEAAIYRAMDDWMREQVEITIGRINKCSSERFDRADARVLVKGML